MVSFNKVTLDTVCDVLNGDRGINYPSSSDFVLYGIPFINAGAIENKKINFRKVDFITESKYNRLSGAKFEKGDIIFCLRGSLGKYAMLDIDRGAPASSLAVLRCKTNSLNNKFLFQLLGSEITEKQISSENNGSSQPNLSAESVKRFLIPLPEITEQIAIAQVLSDVDNLIFSLQKLIEKKNAIKQGAMQELLTGKKRLPGFDEEWRTYKLGELGSFDKGCGISRAESNTGNFPAVRYGELYTKHTDYVKQYYSRISGDVAQTAKRVTFGDILFAASGETKEEIGVCAAIVDRRDIFAGGDIVVFTPTTEINPIFFGTLLNMPFAQKQKSERGQGDAVVHIHADSLSEIIVSIPEKNEQEAIAAVIKDFNDEIEQLEKKLVKYQQIKQGMMQELLTGRIRLV